MATTRQRDFYNALLSKSKSGLIVLTPRQINKYLFAPPYVGFADSNIIYTARAPITAKQQLTAAPAPPPSQWDSRPTLRGSPSKFAGIHRPHLFTAHPHPHPLPRPN